MPDHATAGSAPAKTEAARRILLAARILFAQRGYEGVSIRDVAERAKASKANVFHHFVNKLGLYRAVLDDSSTGFHQVRNELRDSDSPIHDRLETFARNNLRTMLDDPHSVDLFLRLMMGNTDNTQRTMAEETVLKGLRGLIDSFEAMRRDGCLARDTDPTVLALTILGTNFMFFRLRGLMDQLCEHHSGSNPDAFSHSLVELLYPTATSADDSTITR
ncbi:MAG: TetR/AcrR family transcriptional regulator [Aquisalimonadaceae bacterium]